MQSFARLAVAMVVLSLSMQLQVPAKAADEPSAWIVWDATAYVDCVIEISYDDGPWTKQSCEPGTVVFATPATMLDVSARPGIAYVPWTGKAEADIAAVDAMSMSVSNLAAGDDVSAAGTCDGSRRNVNGSYVVGVEPSPRYRIYYALGYSITTTCNASGVADRDKVGPSADRDAIWESSCVEGYGCSGRGITLTPEWTPRYAAPNAYIGARYQNIGVPASCGAFCTRYYGYWDLD